MIEAKVTFERNGSVAALLQDMDRALDDGLSDGAEVLARHVREQLSQPGSGRLYRSRRGDGSIHQASAPGEPPAPDTEALRDSVIPVPTDAAGVARVEVAPPGGWLEGGTRTIQPRPFMGEAIEHARADVLSVVGARLQEHMR